MAVRMVQVRSKATGATTFMAESAVKHFPEYDRTSSKKGPADVPDGSAFLADPQPIPDGDQASTTTQEA